jgi:TolB protein
MNMLWIFLFSIFLFPLATHAHATELSAEIRVDLATQSSLELIYIGKIHRENAAFDISYLNQLEAILAHDLNHNGFTKVTARAPDKEQLLSLKENAAAFDISAWKASGIAYAVRIQLKERFLSMSVCTIHGGSLKTFSAVQLSGDLSQDRRHIHKLSDGIVKALFDSYGVAHSRILFA